MSAAAVLWLMRALGWIRRAAGALIGLSRRYPWQAACIALLACSAWLWRGEHDAIDQRDRSRAEASSLKDAARKANELAAARRKADEHHYKELADNADGQYRSKIADARGATARYIAAHRMRPSTASGASGAAAGEAQGGGAGLSQDSARKAELVAVTAADVNTCADDYGYARAAHDWAASLNN